MTAIGDKHTLWIAKYNREVYTDQMGIKHAAFNVSEEVVVTVTNVIGGISKTIIAVSESGEQFDCIKSTPFISFSYRDFLRSNIEEWCKLKTNLVADHTILVADHTIKIVDAVIQYNDGIIAYLKNGVRAKPEGDHIKYCEKHDRYYYEQGSRVFGCIDCVYGE